MKILFLEDEKILGNLYTKKLQQAGHAVVLTENSKDFLTALQQECFDVVCVDHSLGEETITGLDLLPKIREVLPQCFCIMLSNYSQFHMEKEALEKGADAYCIKLNMSPQNFPHFLQEQWEKKG
jgi:DNA-binding NtrC family response regulator